MVGTDSSTALGATGMRIRHTSLVIYYGTCSFKATPSVREKARLANAFKASFIPPSDVQTSASYYCHTKRKSNRCRVKSSKANKWHQSTSSHFTQATSESPASPWTSPIMCAAPSRRRTASAVATQKHLYLPPSLKSLLHNLEHNYD